MAMPLLLVTQDDLQGAPSCCRHQQGGGRVAQRAHPVVGGAGLARGNTAPARPA